MSKSTLQSLFPEIDRPRPLVIAGPCSAESEAQVLETAYALAAQGIPIFRAGLWKPRTKPGCFEGVGGKGLAWLVRVKKETGMYVATEVATPEHVAAALHAGIDLIWIGARTTSNPFAVQAIAEALRGSDLPVLVKNPSSPDLELWIGAIERLRNTGVHRLGLIHRGFSSYDQTLYRNLPQWAIPIELRRRMPDLPLFCDPSHIGGKRDRIYPIAQQAMDLGFDGLIIESHCHPEQAKSDKEQQLPPEALDEILHQLILREANMPLDGLTSLRSEIDAADDELMQILARRMRIARTIGRYKRDHSMPILQTQRYGDLLDKRIAQAAGLNLDADFIRRFLYAVHEESVRQQMDIFKE
ncbi:MAG: bifunctional 3-deoxy-7-phosphoheptulonate synthase/chorismate mutase type II [Alistipes sp.]